MERRKDDKTAGDAECGPEIEITPQMEEAGAKVLCDFFGERIDWLTCDIARDVFLAMIDCAPGLSDAPPTQMQASGER
jgi:hypothetical protein